MYLSEKDLIAEVDPGSFEAWNFLNNSRTVYSRFGMEEEDSAGYKCYFLTESESDNRKYLGSRSSCFWRFSEWSQSTTHPEQNDVVLLRYPTKNTNDLNRIQKNKI